MADTTRNLGLPLLAAAQAQKHVTHNEALTALDALVQLACLDKDLSAPPAGPAEGDRYLVTAAVPTGAWAGLSGQVVRFEDGIWVGMPPQPGWFAYLVDEADLYVFTGSAWTSFRASLSALQLTRLGIGTAADATNRLAVKSEAALLTWDDVTPGAGNMRQTLNRKASSNDAGLVFQTGYATRALFGTLGSDDVTLTVSPDGSTFRPALVASASTGTLSFAYGATFGASPATRGTVFASATGYQTSRYDDASVQRLAVRANAGIAAAGQGVRDVVQLGSAGAPVDAAYLDWLATDSFAAAVNRSVRATLSLTQAGTLVPVCSFDPALPGIAPASGGAALGSPSLPWSLSCVQRLQIVAQSAAPTGALAIGQLYANSTSTTLQWYNGTAWARINNFAKFAAYTNFDNYVAAATWTKVQFNNADANDQGAFTAASNRFVAPEAGLYQFATSLVFRKNGSNLPTAFEVQFYRNAAAAGRGRACATGALVDQVTALGLTAMLRLAASDTVEVYVRFTTTDGYVAATDSFFGGMQMA